MLKPRRPRTFQIPTLLDRTHHRIMNPSQCCSRVSLTPSNIRINHLQPTRGYRRHLSWPSLDHYRCPSRLCLPCRLKAPLEWRTHSDDTKFVILEHAEKHLAGSCHSSTIASHAAKKEISNIQAMSLHGCLQWTAECLDPCNSATPYCFWSRNESLKGFNRTCDHYNQVATGQFACADVDNGGKKGERVSGMHPESNLAAVK